MKYVAEVTKVVRRIQKIGELDPAGVRTVSDWPAPVRIDLIKGDSGSSCTIERYAADGEFCGDTWHETLAGAFGQAEYEYGLRESDFRAVE
jgi:hypothetical protein